MVEINKKDENRYERMRLIFSYYAIGSSFVAGLFVFVWLFYIFISDKTNIQKFFNLLFEQPAAIIGGPVCVMMALVIVLLLRNIEGPIEFEALSFKFRGASGPIVMWIFCYVALIFSVRFLWNAASPDG